MKESSAGALVGAALVDRACAETESDRLPEPGSFRDRNGSVFYRGDRVFRSLSPTALANWSRLRDSALFGKGVSSGRIVATRGAEIQSIDGACVLEHDRIPFVSYPYEWTFGMLRDAALLHLGLMREALAEDMILKDATPYNIQWRGARPVFIDIPSFEPLAKGAPWVGYRQFCELFLYPLMLQAYRGDRLPPAAARADRWHLGRGDAEDDVLARPGAAWRAPACRGAERAAASLFGRAPPTCAARWRTRASTRR